MRVWGLLVVLAGCGSSTGGDADLGVGDLSMSMPGDLAGSDGASRQLVPLDLAGVDQATFASFCAGTFVAGTCLQTFFAPLADCFVASGSCNQSVPGVVMPTFCWSSGAELQQTETPSTVDRTFISGNVICFTKDIGGPFPKTPWWVAGGQGMFYDPTTGYYDCPDGSKGSIGTNFGGCAALGALVAPDTSGCMPGSCP